MDSAGFFSADTLHLITPYPAWKIVVGNPEDTLFGYPKIGFGVFYKNDFMIDFRGNKSNRRAKYQGKVILNNSGKTFHLDFYEMNPKISTDDMDEWTKYAPLNYKVLKFSTAEILLVKIL